MAPPARRISHNGANGRSFDKHDPNPCYAVSERKKITLASQVPIQALNAASDSRTLVRHVEVPARDAVAVTVPAGGILRVSVTHGPQVGDMNVWNAENPKERFYTSKTRQIHATHLTTGDSLWSCFPYLRPLMTMTADSIGYGIDEDNAGVHDVIGSRCDPYTHKMLTGESINDTCHSNLTRAIAAYGLGEHDVHDVLNVFMCTGFTKGSGIYFSKPSPVVKGDFVEFFAHVNVIVALSACRQGDVATACGDLDSVPRCYPLAMDVYTVPQSHLGAYVPPQVNSYSGGHGLPASRASPGKI